MFRLLKLVSRKSVVNYVMIYSFLKVIYLITPLISMWFLDSVLEGNSNKAVFFAIFAVANLILSQFLDYLFDLKEGKIVCEAWLNLCYKIRKKIDTFDLSEYEISNAQLQHILGQEYEGAKNYIFKNPIRIIFSFITIICIEIIIFTISKLLFVVTLILVPLSLLLSIKSNRIVEEVSHENIDDSKEIKKYLEDSLVLTKQERTLKIKQLHTNNRIEEKYKNSFLRKNKKVAYVNNIISYGSLNLIILVVTILSGFQVYNNIITIGELYAIQIYVSQLWSPCEFLTSVKNEYYEIKPMIEDILKFLNMKDVKFEAKSVSNIEKIVLKDYVSLDNDKNEINCPLTICMEKNNIYIFEGENGVGKTTLVEAMLGYTNRYKGTISNIEMGFASSDIVYIASEPFMSKYFDEKAETGSSGQKKIRQIELALQTDKSVYIFDEPTNYLDYVTKEKVVQLIKENCDRKIIVIVTHDQEFKNCLQKEKISYQSVILSAKKKQK